MLGLQLGLQQGLLVKGLDLKRAPDLIDDFNSSWPRPAITRRSWS